MIRLVQIEGQPAADGEKVLALVKAIGDLFDASEASAVEGFNAALVMLVTGAGYVGLELDQVETAVEAQWKAAGGPGAPLRSEPRPREPLREGLRVPGRVRR